MQKVVRRKQKYSETSEGNGWDGCPGKLHSTSGVSPRERSCGGETPKLLWRDCSSLQEHTHYHSVPSMTVMELQAFNVCPAGYWSDSLLALYYFLLNRSVYPVARYRWTI